MAASSERVPAMRRDQGCWDVKAARIQDGMVVKTLVLRGAESWCNPLSL